VVSVPTNGVPGQYCGVASLRFACNRGRLRWVHEGGRRGLHPEGHLTRLPEAIPAGHTGEASPGGARASRRRAAGVGGAVPLDVSRARPYSHVVFDLETHRVLALNSARSRITGYSREDSSRCGSRTCGRRRISRPSIDTSRPCPPTTMPPHLAPSQERRDAHRGGDSGHGITFAGRGRSRS